MAVELGEFFQLPQEEVWLQDVKFVIEKQEGCFPCMRPCQGPVGTAIRSAQGPKDGGELIRGCTHLCLGGQGEPSTASGRIRSEFIWPGEPSVLSAHGLLCSTSPSSLTPRLIFLLVLLMPQARPHSFKALVGKVLILPSEDSFPRPRGSPHLTTVHRPLPPSRVIEELHRALATKHRQDR